MVKSYYLLNLRVTQILYSPAMEQSNQGQFRRHPLLVQNRIKVVTGAMVVNSEGKGGRLRGLR